MSSIDASAMIPDWSPALECSDSAVAKLVYHYDDADPDASAVFMGLLREAAAELVAAERARCDDIAWSEIHKEPQFTHDARARVVRKKSRPAQWIGATGDSTYVSEDGGPRLMRSVIQERSCHGNALHPTQKPESIIAPLLRYSVPQGGVVLDPFAGSGTTLAVARKTGRRAIGIEASEEYCEVIVNRLAQSELAV